MGQEIKKSGKGKEGLQKSGLSPLPTDVH